MLEENSKYHSHIGVRARVGDPIRPDMAWLAV